MVTRFESILTQFADFRYRRPKASSASSSASPTTSPVQVTDPDAHRVPPSTPSSSSPPALTVAVPGAQPQSPTIVAGAFNAAGTAVVRTSQYVAFGVVKAAALLGRGLTGGGKLLQAHTRPTPRPVQVSETTKGTVRVVKGITGSAVSVSRFVVEGARDVAQALGGLVADGVAATPVIGPMLTTPGSETTEAVKGTVKAGVEAFSTCVIRGMVWRGMTWHEMTWHIHGEGGVFVDAQ